ncbi:MAG: twin-arginine translocase subunit TatC [Sphingomonadales bacterium]|jgi:sec-independent protein translocase protein TatC
MSAENPDELEHSKAPLIEHLIELRKRLLYGLIALTAGAVFGYLVAAPVYDFLIQPLDDAYSAMRVERIADLRADNPELTLAEAQEQVPVFEPVYINVIEPFIMKLKLSLAIGFAIAFPLIASQIWAFIAPGLYRHERKAFFPFLFGMPVLFLTGASLLYYIVMPLAWRFMISVGSDFHAELSQRIGDYLGIVIQMILAFGISFQLPLILMLMARVGFIGSAALKRFRKYAIVCIFAFAAMVTPPDVISQIILGIPLWLLYEMSIFAVRLVEKKRLETSNSV